MDNRTRLEIAGVAVGIFGILFDVNGMIFPDEPVIIEKEVPIYIDKEIVREIETVKEIEVPVEVVKEIEVIKEVPMYVTEVSKKNILLAKNGRTSKILFWTKGGVAINTVQIKKHCREMRSNEIPDKTYYWCKPNSTNDPWQINFEENIW